MTWTQVVIRTWRYNGDFAIRISKRHSVFEDIEMQYIFFLKIQKIIEIWLLRFILYEVCIMRIIFYLFILYLLIHKFLKIPFRNQYFFLFFECMTLFCVVYMIEVGGGYEGKDGSLLEPRGRWGWLHVLVRIANNHSRTFTLSLNSIVSDLNWAVIA
jgi:hypothetical protein